MTQNKLIAVTGGIGSGKSTALGIIEKMGHSVISCDQITKELYGKRWVLKEIKKLFPYAVTGKIFLKVNKVKVAQQAFTDSDKYARLTGYLTPLIFAEAIKKASKLRGNVFVEVPLLFELNYHNKFEKIIVITRKLEDRISSVMARSNLSREQVLDRINKQVDYSKLDLTNYITVNNDGGEAELTEKLKKEIEKL